MVVIRLLMTSLLTVGGTLAAADATRLAAELWDQAAAAAPSEHQAWYADVAQGLRSGKISLHESKQLAELAGLLHGGHGGASIPARSLGLASVSRSAGASAANRANNSLNNDQSSLTDPANGGSAADQLSLLDDPAPVAPRLAVTIGAVSGSSVSIEFTSADARSFSAGETVWFSRDNNPLVRGWVRSAIAGGSMGLVTIDDSTWADGAERPVDKDSDQAEVALSLEPGSGD